MTRQCASGTREAAAEPLGSSNFDTPKPACTIRDGPHWVGAHTRLGPQGGPPLWEPLGPGEELAFLAPLTTDAASAPAQSAILRQHRQHRLQLKAPVPVRAEHGLDPLHLHCR
jgi:hypothetical protein